MPEPTPKLSELSLETLNELYDLHQLFELAAREFPNEADEEKFLDFVRLLCASKPASEDRDRQAA